MKMLIGYAGIGLFLLLVVLVMELTRRKDATLSDYATAGRSFGPFLGMMAFVNTFMPGTVFISFAGLAASSGVIGYYLVVYGLAGVLLMYALARPVYRWGAHFDLRTQADLLGARYGSDTVKLVASGIAIVATIPWVVLGMQSLALVFGTLSFGALTPVAAVLVSVAVLTVRQWWTVRYGMRGVIMSDLVQGLFAYFVGTLVAVGLIVWLVSHGHGFGDVPAGFTSLRGPDDAFGPLYALSITLTGTIGVWCWPDIFVRLFTARSVRSIQGSAIQAAPLLLVFGTAMLTVAYLGSTVEGVAAAPDNVWFLVSAVGGVALLTLTSICVVGATMGNVGANLQALGTQVANDVIGVVRRRRIDDPNVARIAVAGFTVVCAVGAFFTASKTSGLLSLALLSYEGIVQLAPTLLLGVFWRKGTAAGAVAAMSSGFVVAGGLQLLYPNSIPWAGGLTPGVVALVPNVAVYVLAAVLRPHTPDEAARLDRLWAIQRDTAVAGARPDGAEVR